MYWHKQTKVSLFEPDSAMNQVYVAIEFSDLSLYLTFVMRVKIK